MKRIRLGIFGKTFIITTAMMLIITLIAYLVLYILIPPFYKNYKINQYNKLSEQLIGQLENADTVAEEKDILTDFMQKTSSTVNVLNEDQSVFFNLSLYHGVELSEKFDESENQTAIKTEVSQEAEDGDYIHLEYSYTSNGQPRILQIIVALQPLNEAKAVIISIYPISGLLCIFFSFILASLFSHSFVKPIRKIRKITSEMALLKPNAEIQIVTSDEIGELSKDINNLYQELRGTISTLEKEMKIYSNLENERIDFLRTISHELKTPLASANALIEGIIYDVEPYCDNPNKYLTECKSFLDKSIQLTKESLNLNPGYNEKVEKHNLKDLITDVFSLYRVIVRFKQIRYTVNIPNDIYITTKVKMFSHALSNIFSNAVNYTMVNGEIRVKYLEDDRALVIENICMPLTENELKNVFLPFSSGKKHSHVSNGLGLYIVKQILVSLKIGHYFLPMEDKKGMRFKIFMPNSDLEQ